MKAREYFFFKDPLICGCYSSVFEVGKAHPFCEEDMKEAIFVVPKSDLDALQAKYKSRKQRNRELQDVIKMEFNRTYEIEKELQAKDQRISNLESVVRLRDTVISNLQRAHKASDEIKDAEIARLRNLIQYIQDKHPMVLGLAIEHEEALKGGG